MPSARTLQAQINANEIEPIFNIEFFFMSVPD